MSGGAARAAAEAWADKLFGVLPGRDNGTTDAEDPTGMQRALFLLHASAVAGDGSQDREKFVEVMTRIVDARLSDGASSLTYATDYGPDYEWREIIAESGVSPGRFPWKSCMWIRPDHVTASFGYQAASVLLWHAEDWQRPECGSAEYVDDPAERYGYRQTGRSCVAPIYHDGGHDYREAPARTGGES